MGKGGGDKSECSKILQVLGGPSQGGLDWWQPEREAEPQAQRHPGCFVEHAYDDGTQGVGAGAGVDAGAGCS